MELLMGEYIDKTNFTSTNYMHINSCGKQVFINNTYTLLRSKGRIDYHILYILKGKCDALYMNKIHTLQSGDMIIYKPTEKQMYTFSRLEKTESYYVHFSGIGAEEILKRSNLWGSGIFHVGTSEEVKTVLDNLVKEFSLKKHQYNMFCECYLLELLAITSRITTVHQENITPKNCEKIYQIIELMFDNYQNKIDIDMYAEKCNFSKDRFVHLFKEVTGMAPYRYQLKIRIDKAKYLLKNSTLNVSEISAAVGFDDPLYFSRLFKRRTGTSPTTYRENEESV